MGDGSDGTDVVPEPEAAVEKSGEIWGTLEELLLACAVTRHGTSSWDSVAMEVQTRSPLAARPGLTPHSCRLRFRHLHRRFSSAGSGAEEEVEVEEGSGDDPDASAAEGWVDELRRLRVAELRRDVERCDLSIGTLQSKVKRLREERDRSLSGEAKPDEASGNDRLSGEEPGRSCRESNSTDLKPPKHPGGVKEEVAKQEASGESAAASKESSDVRSSASLCRRRRRGKATSGAEEEEAASTPRPPPSQSPPLSVLLDAVAAKLGPVMERLREHESEEAAAYRGTIRHHVDLEVVRGKLEASTASRADDDDDCYPASEFYRDLLLLCTNAVVFFPRSVPEHAAAVEARALLSEHASTVLREPKQERVVAVSAPEPGPAPAGSDIVGPLIEKKPLIVCRKRSSIAKAAAMKKEIAVKAEAEKEKEQEESDEEKEPVAAVTKDMAWGMRTKKRGGAVRRLAGTRLTDDTATADGAKKAGKKGTAGDGAAAGGLTKKRNAVDFLKRLNQGSSPTKKRGSPLGTTRRRLASAAAAEEQPKTRKRGTGRKDGTGRGGGKRGGKAKRGVGRPLKRGAGPITPPPSKRVKTSRGDKPATGKRGGRRSVG